MSKVGRKIIKNSSRGVKWLARLLTAMGVVVVYYLIFSVLFDTPIEYQLKKSTTMLQSHYETLERRYDSLQLVLANLSDRDSAVYKIIYEAQPYSYRENTNLRRVKLLSRLNSMSNKDLGELFFSRLSGLVVDVDSGYGSISSVVSQCLDNSYFINHIPSIQPISNPDLNLLATSFGRRINPFFKTMQNHDGVDYAVAEGTAIFATADGVISEIKTRGSNNGLSITLDHGNGYKTVYAYLSRTYGQVGAKVNRGDVIAFSGNSGLSYAPHLHYEVRKDGKAVNPLGYLFLELNKEEQLRLNNIAAHAMQSFD